jgi:hypothetical protein
MMTRAAVVGTVGQASMSIDRTPGNTGLWV